MSRSEDSARANTQNTRLPSNWVDDNEAHADYLDEPAADHHHHNNNDKDGTPTHADAERLYRVLPFLRHVPVFGKATSAFGPKLIISLGASYVLCKGAAGSIISQSRQPMMIRRFGIDALRYQRLASLYSMGWSIKAFFAAITDTFALFHFTKRYYMLISAVAGGAFALGYAVLPPRASSANAAAAFIFLTSFSKANIDILAEALYSREMRRIPAAGPSMISWVWWSIYIGNTIAACLIGPLSDAGLIHVAVYISAGLQLLTATFSIFNWYGEKTNRVERLEDAKRLHEEWLAIREEEHDKADKDAQAAKDADAECDIETPTKAVLPHTAQDAAQGVDATAGPHLPEELVYAEEAALERASDDVAPGALEFEEPEILTCLCGIFEVNKEVVTRNWRIVVYSGIMTAAVITLAVVTILGSTWDLLYACIAIAVVCCGLAFWALPLAIAKATVFIFFNFCLYLQIPGALNNFYLAGPDCLPGGPHFTYTFYTTVASIITNVAGMAGAILFTYVFSQHSYPFVFIATTCLQVIASMFDLIIVERWNLYIGIPDHAMYLCGYAIIYEVVYTMSFMPVQVLMSRLCPRGSEAMVFALMAGFANTGSSMSNAIGSLLMELVWPVSAKVPCDFSNVRYLIITGHLCTPLLVVPLAFLLLPSARICDEINVDGHTVRQAHEKNNKKKGDDSDSASDSGAAEPYTQGDEVHDKDIAFAAGAQTGAVVAAPFGGVVNNSTVEEPVYASESGSEDELESAASQVQANNNNNNNNNANYSI